MLDERQKHALIARFDTELKAYLREQLDCRQLVRDANMVPPRQARASGSKRLIIRCPSPHHEDKNPSCAVFPDGFKCYACQARGDVFELLGHIELIHSFHEQIDRAAGMLGIDHKKTLAAYLRHAEAHGSAPSLHEAICNASGTATTPLAPVRVSTPTPQPDPPTGPSASTLDVWASLFGLLPRTITPACAQWLERERGLDANLVRACAVREADGETWSNTLEALEEEYSGEALEEAGLINSKGLFHPRPQTMLVIGYPNRDNYPIGVRFRFAEVDRGPKYMSVCGAHNRARAPYMGAEDGLPLLECSHRPIWITEGEFDALALMSIGQVAMGVPGALRFIPEWVDAWEARRAPVIVFADADRDGVRASQDFEHTIREALEARVDPKWVERWFRVVRIPAKHGAKDPCDLNARGELGDFVNDVLNKHFPEFLTTHRACA